jgi:hypothetical protein
MHTGLLAFAGVLCVGVALAATSTAAAAASDQVCTGVVVDDANGAPPSLQAAHVAPGTTDLQALSAVGETPTQNNSGLVCAIANYPTNGLQNCTSSSNGQFNYWSYWQGDPYTNTWTYAQVGPASHSVSDGQTYVEGWRYQNPGPDNASAPKPSVTPSAAFAAACPGVTPVAPASAGGGSGSAGGSSGSAGSAPAALDPPPPTTVPPTGAAAGSSTQKGSGSGTGGSGAARSLNTTTTTAPGTRSTTNAAPGATTTTLGSGDTAVGGSTHGSGSASTKGTAVASAASHNGGGGTSGNYLPAILIAVVVAGLGGLALFRWRRRPAEE